jgi:magnesium chelatase subunit I
MGDAPSRGEAAAGVEFALEGLYLTRRLSKEYRDDGRSVYRRESR